jgi:hypothetical protein
LAGRRPMLTDPHHTTRELQRESPGRRSASTASTYASNIAPTYCLI